MATRLNPDSFYLPVNFAVPSGRCLKRPRDSQAVSTLAAQVLLTKKPKHDDEMHLPLDDKALTVALRTQVDQIKLSLERRSPSSGFFQQAQTHILDIIHHPHWSEEIKYAELGVLCYFITSGHALPALGLSEALLQEIEERVYRMQRKKNDPLSHSEQPSDSLLFQFAKMIFSADGGFNRGGCYAVRSFLNGKLQNVVSKELEKQIILVVEHLIGDDSFCTLFREPFAVHEPLLDLIRNDMHLSPKEEVTFVDVRWDLLINLFKMEGGDYRAHLEMLLAVLNTGYTFCEQMQIPVKPLWEICHKTLQKNPGQNHLEGLGKVLTQFRQLNNPLGGSKIFFCASLHQGILNTFIKEQEDSSAESAFSLFLNWITKRLFLTEEGDVNFDIVNYKVVFDGHSCTFPFTGNSADYRPFSEIRRLFFLSEGELIPLDTLTALGECYANYVEKMIERGSLQTNLKKYITSDLFKQAAAQSVAMNNLGRSAFDAAWYLRNDALILLV